MPDRSPAERAVTARNEMAARIYLRGMTLEFVGEAIGVSRQRVQQILIGLEIARRPNTSTERVVGQHSKTLRMCAKHCISRDELVAAKADGRWRAFCEQRENALTLGAEWNLTFSSWWWLWNESGRWRERGRRFDKFVLVRDDLTGPYSIENVSIRRFSDHMQRAVKRYRSSHVVHAIGGRRNGSRIAAQFHGAEN